jgi:hypothetical protein
MTYKIQIDDLIRDATDEEAAAIKAKEAEAAQHAQAEADKAAARQKALDKLGLTANEAQALLG